MDIDGQIRARDVKSIQDKQKKWCCQANSALNFSERLLHPTVIPVLILEAQR